MADGARPGVDGVLAAARARIARVEPEPAWAAASAGQALIVDLRSSDERRRRGIVPGSIHIPRSVLEWRVDPASEWRNPFVAGEKQLLLLLCAEGFSSSLAAAALLDLGLERAGDVVGGFTAWRRAGLPIVPVPGDDVDGPPGMGPPETVALPAPPTADTLD